MNGIMIDLKLLVISICLCAIGCAPNFTPSNLYNRSSLADIELVYQRLFDMENKVQREGLLRQMNQIPFIRKGGADYQLPGTISLYDDLQYMLDRSFAGGDDVQIKIRQYLIKKIGVISPMVSFPRSDDVKFYLSPRDRFALTKTEIGELYGNHSPRYSSLTVLLMEMNPHAHQ